MDGNDATTATTATAAAAAAAAAAGRSDAATIKARSGGRRKSCNRCSRKKERCDGQEPCQRCTRSGLECLYDSCRTLGRPRNAPAPPKRRAKPPSAEGTVEEAQEKYPSEAERRGDVGGGSGVAAAGFGVLPPRPRAPQAAFRPRKGIGSGAGGGCGAAAAAVKPKRKPTPRSKAVGAGAGAGAALTPATTLKRPSFSPSPATGLAGMVQNRYLTCFVDDFACFFKILDEVTIRLGLINLMSGKVDSARLADATGVAAPLPPKKRQTKACIISSLSSARQGGGGGGGGGDGGEQRQQRQQVTAAALDAAAVAEDHQVVVNAVNSSVFSAMSLGAMLLGQPPAHVHSYVMVAEVSLRMCGNGRKVAAAVPNEHVAAAALLLAFAANVSGKGEYGLHIRFARQCYDARVRNGLATPTPIRESLGYRAIIDAMGKPPDDRDLRVPSPSKEARVTASQSAGTCTSDCGNGSNSSSSTSSSSSSSSEGGGGSSMQGPGIDSGGLESQPSLSSAGGGGAKEAAAAPSDGGGRMASPDTFRAAESEKGRHRQPPPPPMRGLEAARERRRLRRAEPMSMVADIMTMLSRVPWTAHVEEAARRTKRELMELRKLMIAEKALVEERRFVSEVNMRRSEGIASFALASALIGLYLALDEFSELLHLARELASCLHACPGLARYQPHGYHSSLVILAAFGKRSEFEALLAAVPMELRFSASTGEPLTYEAHSDTCSHPVCLKHAKVIAEMGRELGNEEGGAAAGAAADGDVQSVGEKAERDKETYHSLSGKVMIRAATSAAAAGENSLVLRQASSAPGEARGRVKNATLVFRCPSPPDSPVRRLQDGCHHPSLLSASSSFSAAVSAHRQQGPVVAGHRASASTSGKESTAAGAGALAVSEKSREAGEVARDEEQCWLPQSSSSSWAAPMSVSGEGSTRSDRASVSTSTSTSLSSVTPAGGGGKGKPSRERPDSGGESPPPQRQTQTFAHLQSTNGRVLPTAAGAAATVADTPTGLAASGLTRATHAADGGGCGRSNSEGISGSSNHDQQLARQRLNQLRVASTATYGLTVFGERGAAATAQATAGNVTGNFTFDDTLQGPSLYDSYREKQRQLAAPLGSTEAGGGVRAMQVAASTGGTLTSRLWGLPEQPLTSPHGPPSSSGGAGCNFTPTLHSSNNPGLVHHGRWHPYFTSPTQAGTAAAAAAAASAPRVMTTGSVRAVHPAVMLPPSLPLPLPPPPASQGGLMPPPDGAVRAPFLFFSRTGGRLGPPSTGHSAEAMTTGKASAAAISLNTTMRAGASTDRATGSSIVQGGAGDGAEGVEGGKGAVEGDSGCAEASRGEPHEEEIMDLWDLIGSGE